MTKRKHPDHLGSHHMGRDLFPDFRWNETNTADLKRLWPEGLSAGQIGAELGCSRNAVIGKATRIGLTGSPVDAARRAERKANGNGGGIVVRVKAKRTRIASAHTGGTTQRMNNRANGSNAPVEPIPINMGLAEFNASVPPWQRKTIVELHPGHCRFPLWDDDDPSRFYCGGEGADMPGKPFCTEHERFAYKPSTGAKPWMPGRS